MASIYAEFLANIQQVAIYVTLPSLPTWNTVVTLNGDKVTVTTKHYGSNTTALLPAKVQGPSELVLHDDQSLEHSWRLPVIPDGTRPSTAFPLDAVNDAPWSAFDMTSKASILCLVCLRQKKFQPLVERGKVKVWKDLPSQNWAELMEFWHCHKPSDVSSGKELRTSSKGYSAESSLLAEQGTGLINTTSFLLAEGDCTGLSSDFRHQLDSVQSTPNDATEDLQCLGLHGKDPGPRQVSKLHCNQCSSEIGEVDKDTAGLILFKWAVAVSHGVGQKAEAFPIENFISAQILGILESHGVQHIIAHCNNQDLDVPLLKLWPFNKDLRYTKAPSFSSTEVQRAMKVFFQVIDSDQARREIDAPSAEELYLGPKDLKALYSALQESRKLLPESATRFRGWDVGLLSRFSLSEA